MRRHIARNDSNNFVPEECEYLMILRLKGQGQGSAAEVAMLLGLKWLQERSEAIAYGSKPQRQFIFNSRPDECIIRRSPACSA